MRIFRTNWRLIEQGKSANTVYTKIKRIVSQIFCLNIWIKVLLSGQIVLKYRKNSDRLDPLVKFLLILE